MSATTVTNTCTQPTKFSRYRSVRRAANSAPIPEDVPAVPEANAQLNRAPSRYHRANRPHVQTLPLPAQTPLDHAVDQANSHHPRTNGSSNQIKEDLCNGPPPPCYRNGRLSQDRQGADHGFAGGPVQNQRMSGATNHGRENQLSRTISNATRSTVASPKSYEAAREEARMILEGEYDRIQKIKQTQRRHEQRQEAEATELKRRATQVQQQTSKPVYVDAPKLTVKRRIERSLPEKFHDAPQSIGLKASTADQGLRPNAPHDAKQQLSTNARFTADVSVPSAPKTFDAPKFDAPISAVNAGERRIEVRLSNAERGITLPVTPTTNSKDLLNSASVVMSENFDPRTSVLVESFSKLGLERPLRRYEHVRDVMNSWDSDDQNYLTIMTESECTATGLERHEAPSDEPVRVMVQMYLILRPGKWDKRWVILRPDGQVTMSKLENDGDGANICHLSDFDVYTPTERQRKKLKPPKKFCFAIKSQQKSAMFLEGNNYVHFFATSDKKVADQWYTAVQTWRSWYLVHILGEGNQKPKESANLIGNVPGIGEGRPATAQSADTVPYQLGSFKPLLDFSDLTFDFDAKQAESTPPQKKQSFELGVGQANTDVVMHEAARRGSRQRGAPPSAFPSKLFSEIDNKGRASLDNSDQAFTGGGLLARSASTRRSQGSKSSGYGVAGAPGKPLVDLTPASEFVEGSLLRKLEAWSATHGELEPKIDRHRRIEADIKVGEGLG